MYVLWKDKQDKINGKKNKNKLCNRMYNMILFVRRKICKCVCVSTHKPFYGSNHKELLVMVTFGEMKLKASMRGRLSFFILDIFLGLYCSFFLYLHQRVVEQSNEL